VRQPSRIAACRHVRADPLAAEQFASFVVGGGIGHGSQVAAAIAMGADAVLIGTRMLASAEIDAHSAYKARLIEADEVVAAHHAGLPQHVSRARQRRRAQRRGAGAAASDFVRYRPFVAGQHQKHAYQTGEWERGVLSMGQAVAFVRQPQTVAEIYAQLLQRPRRRGPGSASASR
jgi:nitronate monooxygenase